MAFILDPDAMGAGIQVESFVSQKSDQGYVRAFGQLDGEAGGRTDGYYYFNTSHCCLLQELEAGAAAQQEDEGGKRKEAPAERMADGFVEGVMAADVFPQDVQFSIPVEEGSGMEAAGGIEDVLVFAKAGREVV